MLDPIFDFAKQNKNVDVVSDDNLTEFARFAREGWGINEADVLKDLGFVRVRLQYTLTLCRSGLRPAKQQMLATDPQVSAAANAMSKAAAFVRSPKSQTLSVN